MIYLLTGATRGIGAAIAAHLVADGHRVGLLVRDVVEGERLATRLNETGPGHSVVVEADLGDLAGARAAAARVSGLPEPIAALIHNAGVWPRARVLNRDGVEVSFAVNHLAPYLLNHLLDGRLRADRSRVVQVSAGLVPMARLKPALAVNGDDFSELRTYANTKLANVLVSRRRAAAWAGSGVTLNLVHPGVVNTGLGYGGGGLLDWLVRPIKQLWLTPADGARGPVRLATDPSLAAVHDRWFDQLVERPWPAVANDPALAETLDHQAAELCGLPAVS